MAHALSAGHTVLMCKGTLNAAPHGGHDDRRLCGQLGQVELDDVALRVACRDKRTVDLTATGDRTCEEW